ncbi:hypothetical protein [Flavobacterium lindanitolerans]|uniref:hypothetical protein n=1 Tax=Flavobacterium lindanitolerans TaxID=428988 RepID=UPI0031E444E5
MAYYPYYHQRKYFSEDVLVYIEEVDLPNNTIIFDFIDSNELELFSNITNSENNLERPSMVVLTNYKGKKIQENTIYSIKTEIIRSWSEEQLINQQLDSFLIGFRIENSDNSLNVFSNSVPFSFLDKLHVSPYIWGKRNIDDLNLNFTGKISVNIRDVEQGNWNEIYYGETVKIVFDSGAPINASKADIISIIGNRNTKYSKDKPILILSHWDKDHYHSLLGMTDAELANNFSKFICRDKVPNLTSRILFSRIRRLLGNQNIYCIAEIPKSKTDPFFQNISPITRQIVLYNSQENKNRNISGLVLTVKSANKSIILSGDSHYKHISDSILSHLNYPNEHHLVVPHHGGKAGPYKYNLPTLIQPGKAIISVGLNNYGHPLRTYRDSLKLTGFRICQTRISKSDIIINL